MLIRFTVEKFLSFKKRVEFSMIPAPKSDWSHHLIDGKDSDVISVLKSVFCMARMRLESLI